jgi:hypothetical protein
MKCFKICLALVSVETVQAFHVPPLMTEIFMYHSFKEKEKNINVLIILELTNLVSIDTLYISIINKGLMYINSALLC